MKKETVFKKLGNFKSVQKKFNQTYFYSRVKTQGDDRAVLVVDQGTSIVCLPLYVTNDGQETVAFHAKTIKSLIEFLGGN